MKPIETRFARGMKRLKGAWIITVNKTVPRHDKRCLQKITFQIPDARFKVGFFYTFVEAVEKPKVEKIAS